MVDDHDPIRKLQILLHASCQNPAKKEEVKRIVEKTGMTVGGEGIATLSARMSDRDFKKLFFKDDDSQSLTIPEFLKPFVSSISEAPDHLSF